MEVKNENAMVDDVVKQQIRTLVSTLYDMQKLRISAGNRLTSLFYKRFGVDMSEVNEDKEQNEKADKILNVLRKEYERITDGMAENHNSVRKQISLLVGDKEQPLKGVLDVSDFNIIHSYMMLLESEEGMTKTLDSYVKSHPMWDAFFRDIKGCGTLMSAVCIAYLDPYKARHVSSFYRYAGLDTVQSVDKQGNRLWLATEDGNRVVKEKVRYTYVADGSEYKGKVISGAPDADGMCTWTTNTGELLDCQPVFKDGCPVYEGVNEGEADYVGEVVPLEHGRRKGDTEMFEYTDAEGKIQLKRGITYNPILKTKLMGVLTGCLMKAQDPTYSTIYYDYKKRLELSVYHKGKNAAHKNMMAQRYMIKQFLRNMWTTWRQLEGLPVDNPYEVDKLGHKPHKYNEYQCRVASQQ